MNYTTCKTDPLEEHNLIFDPQQQQLIRTMRADLHKILEEAHANRVPFSHKRSMGSNLRSKNGSEPADFPEQWIKGKKTEDDSKEETPKKKSSQKTLPNHQSNVSQFSLGKPGTLTGDFEGACCEYHMIQARLKRIAALKQLESTQKTERETVETRSPMPTRRAPLPNY